MKIRLKDIIDLDYLIAVDDALESDEDLRSRRIKDRFLYSQCGHLSQSRRALLFSWLVFRREEFLRDQDKKGLKVLPGQVFSFLYTSMVYIALFLGGIAGISTAYSFLAYHGTRPINVAVFIAIFIVLQVILILLTLILILRIKIGKKTPGAHTSIIHTLSSSVFFDVLPRLLQKTGLSIFKNSLDTLEYTSSFIRMKNREYKVLFFWPFFLLSSLFAFSFSAGALGGTFFRVIASDMAFGWQSTLMASSEKVHELVSLMGLPWSWFLPIASPSLEQIEGSRIILKDGISVLLTGDLVSWWPFLCMGILFYAVIPRGVLILAGSLAHMHVLNHFNVEKPRFSQLIVRMQSQVLDIDAGQIPVPHHQNSSDQDLDSQQPDHPHPDNQIPDNQNSGNQNSDNQSPDHPDSGHLKPENRNLEMPLADEMERTAPHQAEPFFSGGRALIIASKTVYSDAAIIKAIQQIETQLFFDVIGAIGISFDFDKDTEAVRRINKSDADQVVLLHEVWQPPIRGLLYYITRLKAAMTRDLPLWILLTGDAGMEDLSVDRDDLNFGVWKKAVFKLEDPDIVVKRFIES